MFFEYFENAWSCPSMIVSPCRKIWYPKCWNQLEGNFFLSACKKINFTSNFFFQILKILQTCYFGNFGNAWTSLSKITLSKETFILICKQKINLTLSRRRPISYRNQSIDLLCKRVKDNFILMPVFFTRSIVNLMKLKETLFQSPR